ncbi:MAG: hypothetical protein WC289_02310 [Patescibacteria group bacterium]|jgi:hypothetical protein
MPSNLVIVIGAIFAVAIVVVIARIMLSRKPDVDFSVGEKIAIVLDHAGNPRIQVKCTFSAHKSQVTIGRMRLVLNRTGQFVAHQFIEDFANPYVGAKATITSMQVDKEWHEGIEFSLSGETAPVWNHGNNLLLVKIWLDQNASEHSPSKMYRIDFRVDDHAIARLALKGSSPECLYATVQSLRQVYPAVSFTLSPSRI